MLFRRKRKPSDSSLDFRAIYLMGLVWTVSGLPIALVSSSHALLLMGLCFLGLGLAYRSSWPDMPKKDSPEHQRTIFILAAVTVIAVLTNILLLIGR